MAHQAGRCTVHGCLGRPWQHGSIGVAPARALVGVHRACWESSSCQAWLCVMSDDQQPCGYMQIQVSRTDLAERNGHGLRRPKTRQVVDPVGKSSTRSRRWSNGSGELKR